MLEMLAVPFEGSPHMDPHSEALASEDGMMLLDIPDEGLKDLKMPEPAASQVGDLFAQISAYQSAEISHSCQTAHNRSKKTLVDFYG